MYIGGFWKLIAVFSAKKMKATYIVAFLLGILLLYFAWKMFFCDDKPKPDNREECDEEEMVITDFYSSIISAQEYEFKEIDVDLDVAEILEPETNLDDFRCLILQDDFIESYCRSLRELSKWKISRYKKLIKETPPDTGGKFKQLTEGKVNQHAMYKRGVKRWEKHKEMWDKEYTRKCLQDAVNNRKEGFSQIATRKKLSTMIVRLLVSFSKRPETFTSAYQNIAVCGDNGTGKTRSAKAIARIYWRAGIIINREIYELSTGATGSKFHAGDANNTRDLYLNALDAVIFADEAYSLTGVKDITGDRRGADLVSAMVDYIDKHKGLCYTIVAGYEDDMKFKFFGENQGLRRRFDNQIVLENFTIKELTNIFIRNFQYDINDYQANLIYTLLKLAKDEQYDIFKSNAGDMETLASLTMNVIATRHNVEWGRDLKQDTAILKQGLDNFRQQRSFQ